MNLLKSDIVGAQYDVLWEDVSATIAGAGIRHVLILISETDKGAEEQVQLRKMLDACKLKPEDYNIITLQADKMIAWHQLREKLDPKIVFLIGIAPLQLGISSLFRLNEPNSFNDRIFLPTISIREQEQFPDMKKQLWINGMKPIFVDKKFVAF